MVNKLLSAVNNPSPSALLFQRLAVQYSFVLRCYIADRHTTSNC